MREKYPTYIVGFIAAYAKEIDIGLSKTQVIKFLYLADLFYARKQKKSLTGWPWRYWHYGPYCQEAAKSIDIARQYGFVVVEEGLERELFIKSCKFGSEQFEPNIPLEILHSLKYHLKKFGGDLTVLLNYIYSETEPMLAANYGDYLDFSKAEELPPIKKISLPKMSKQRYEKCRFLIQRLSQKRKETLQKRKPIFFSEKEVKIVDELLHIWDDQKESPELSFELIVSDK